ncbi:MAG: flagellar basal body P-ring protein FlgI, partial [Phycisphaerae bacterium]
IMALASGPLEIDDPLRPTTARIAQGATLEQDWVHTYVAFGRDLAVFRAADPVRPIGWVQPDEPYVTLVLDRPHAEWSVAYAVAQSINEEATIPEPGQAPAQLAMAFDPRTVLVRLPAAERANPAPFLARIENLPLLMPYTEARVLVNYTTGDIVLSGDVEIAPVIISHKGLTITTTLPQPPATVENPQVVEKDFLALDPEKKGGAKLADLLDALNQIRVSAPDRVAIIKKIHEAGKLHATLIVEK